MPSYISRSEIGLHDENSDHQFQNIDGYRIDNMGRAFVRLNKNVFI